MYLADNLVQSTGGDKKHPDGCPRNGEGQPEGSESFEMDQLRDQTDQEASATLGDNIRRLSQTGIDLLNKLAEKNEAKADSDVATDARKAAGQAALDRSAAAAISAAPTGSNVATTLLALPQQQQQQQQNTIIDMPNQIEKKKK